MAKIYDTGVEKIMSHDLEISARYGGGGAKLFLGKIMVLGYRAGCGRRKSGRGDSGRGAA
ncbi:conserved hypothetical protein [Ricinus communis]|uniref:Uncharacterized protein n=1 Tax=Ricinus communis TaxID=3988 RepID=B9T0F9_RICCO|nr:conserved hypothetical protein [Ricinus communis]